MRTGLTFADVLLVPQYSDIDSRLDIDVQVEYLGKSRLPIMSAPMDYVSGEDMAKAMAEAGGYGVVSRFLDEDIVPNAPYDRALSAGLRDGEAQALIEKNNPHAICIDVAHGHHKKVIDLIKTIKNEFPSLYIIAGNVATSTGYSTLVNAGADAVRVGIGPGSACTTRETTGAGVPQLTAIMDAYESKQKYGGILIADGGIQNTGDIVKALAAGADVVMLGRMLAGHKECPGENIQGRKPFRGMSTLGSNASRGAPEGVSGWISAKGFVRDTIYTYIHYLRSGMSYVGARNLEELKESEFIMVSPNTAQESSTRI